MTLRSGRELIEFLSWQCNISDELADHIIEFDKRNFPKFKVGDIVETVGGEVGEIIKIDLLVNPNQAKIYFPHVEGYSKWVNFEGFKLTEKNLKELKFKVGDIVSITHCENYVGRITQIDRFHLRAFLVGHQASFDIGWEYLDHLLHYSSKPKKIKKIVNDGTTDYTLTDKINEIVDHLNNI